MMSTAAAISRGVSYSGGSTYAFHAYLYSSAGFTGLVLAAAIAGCGGQMGPAGGPNPNGRHSDYIVTAQQGVFLGAQVNPSSSPYQQQEPELLALENYIQRPLALHHVYRTWSELATDLTQDPEMGPDKAAGRVDVIAMNCGDNINNKTHLMDIVGGSDDQDLTSIRTSINALNYPVMLRWFWEFNLNAAFPTNGDPNNNNGCFQTPDPNANPTPIPDLPTQFILAYQHVRSVLLGNTVPIPNITFIWNPSEVSDGNFPPGVNPWPYYPGDQYVNWIGFDGYSRLDNNGNPLTFDGIFQSDIQTAGATHPNEPVMIGETGACNNYPAPNQGWQQTYIKSIQTELDNGTYPKVHAALYFDAPGSYIIPKGPKCDWSLVNQNGNAALTAFYVLANDPNFTGMITQNNP